MNGDEVVLTCHFWVCVKPLCTHTTGGSLFALKKFDSNLSIRKLIWDIPAVASSSANFNLRWEISLHDSLYLSLLIKPIESDVCICTFPFLWNLKCFTFSKFAHRNAVNSRMSALLVLFPFLKTWIFGTGILNFFYIWSWCLVWSALNQVQARPYKNAWTTVLPAR